MRYSQERQTMSVDAQNVSFKKGTEASMLHVARKCPGVQVSLQGLAIIQDEETKCANIA